MCHKQSLSYIHADSINDPGFQEKDLEAQEKDDLKTFGVSSDLVSAM